VQLAGDALADGDHEVLAEENADLPGVYLLALVVVAGRAQHRQLDPAGITLHFGSQVKGLGVFDSKIVQIEAVSYLGEFLRAGFKEAEPYEPGLCAAASGLF
jgi:hypothetical protein